MTSNWAFDHLNQLTPNISPENGPSNPTDRDAFNFSLPVNNVELQAQLQAWTNVAFDFDQPLDLSNQFDEFSSPKESEQRLNYHSALSGFNHDSLPMIDHSILSSTSGTSTFPSLPSFGDSSTLDLLSSYHLPILPFTPFNELTTPSTSTSTSITPPANTSTTTTINSTTAPTTSKKVNAKKRRQSVGPSDIISPEEGGADDFPALVLGNDEAANAIAIEEDKRRRNTAASARFRIKKKQREADLQSAAKGLKDRVAELEKEVASLKQENTLLRGLVTEKSPKGAVDAKVKLESF